MRNFKQNKKQDTVWIWVCAAIGVVFIAFTCVLAGAVLRGKEESSHLSEAEIMPAPMQSAPVLKGLIVNPHSQTNYFDFLLDTGERGFVTVSRLEPETRELINYFFLGITLPSEDFWVNLNFAQKDKIISPRLGVTDMGRVLLEADLRLKKDTACLTDPRNPVGARYWQILKEELGTLGRIDAPFPAGNRVWIVPSEAVVEEEGDMVRIAKSSLKVCLESDYMENYEKIYSGVESEEKGELKRCAERAMEEAILPVLEYKVNYAREYAPLRQIYNSLILAECFKRKYWGGGSFFSHCVNQCYLDGLRSKERWSKRGYFDAYVRSVNAGEHSFSRSEYDPYQLGMVQRHYFSGGIRLANLEKTLDITSTMVPLQKHSSSPAESRERSLEEFLTKNDPAPSLTVYDNLETGNIVSFIILPKEKEKRLSFQTKLLGLLKEDKRIPIVLLTEEEQTRVGIGVLIAQKEQEGVYEFLTIGEFDPLMGDAGNPEAHAAFSRKVFIRREDVSSGGVFLERHPVQQGQFTACYGERIKVNSQKLRESLSSNLQSLLQNDMPPWLQGTVIAYQFGGYQIVYTIPVHSKTNFFKGHALPIGAMTLSKFISEGHIICLDRKDETSLPSYKPGGQATSSPINNNGPFLLVKFISEQHPVEPWDGKVVFEETEGRAFSSPMQNEREKFKTGVDALINVYKEKFPEVYALIIKKVIEEIDKWDKEKIKETVKEEVWKSFNSPYKNWKADGELVIYDNLQEFLETENPQNIEAAHYGPRQLFSCVYSPMALWTSIFRKKLEFFKQNQISKEKLMEAEEAAKESFRKAYLLRKALDIIEAEKSGQSPRSSPIELESLKFLQPVLEAMRERDVVRFEQLRKELEQAGMKTWLIDGKGLPEEWQNGKPVPIDNPWNIDAAPQEDICKEAKDFIETHCLKIGFKQNQIWKIIKTAEHLIENAEEHSLAGYGLLIIREVNRQDGQKGIDISCIEDGRETGGLSLKKQLELFETRKQHGRGGMGLTFMLDYNDTLIIFDKRPGQSCKMWSSDTPDEEREVDIPWLNPHGRITIARKWVTSSPAQTQPSVSEPGGIDFTLSSSPTSPFMEESIIRDIVRGVVREGFLKPGLKVIIDSQVFYNIQEIRLDYGDLEAAGAGGQYLYRKWYDDAEKESYESYVYKKIFQYLDEKYPGEHDRFALLPEDAEHLKEKVVRHEILHDILELSSREQKDTLRNLADSMYNFSQDNLQFKKAYVAISGRQIERAEKNRKYRNNMLEEFIAEFFAVPLTPFGAPSFYIYRDHFLYLQRNMPEDIRQLYYDLGFIWPGSTSSPIKSNTRIDLTFETDHPPLSSPIEAESIELFRPVWEAMRERDVLRFEQLRKELEQAGMGTWLIESKGYSPLYREPDYPYPYPINNPWSIKTESLDVLQEKVRSFLLLCSHKRGFNWKDIENIIYAAKHLLDNAEEHNLGGYGLLIVREVNSQDGRKGIEVVCIGDGKELEPLSLYEQVKLKVSTKNEEKRIQGYGLFVLNRDMDELVIFDKPEGQPCKMWSSDRPDEEREVDIPWLSRYGRITIARKWVTSSPVQNQPPAPETGGIDFTDAGPVLPLIDSRNPLYKVSHDFKDAVNTTIRYLKTEKGIELPRKLHVFIFGRYADNKQTPESDFDVGFFLGISEKRKWLVEEECYEFSEELNKQLRRKGYDPAMEIDVFHQKKKCNTFRQILANYNELFAHLAARDKEPQRYIIDVMQGQEPKRYTLAYYAAHRDAIMRETQISSPVEVESIELFRPVLEAMRERDVLRFEQLRKELEQAGMGTWLIESKGLPYEWQGGNPVPIDNPWDIDAAPQGIAWKEARAFIQNLKVRFRQEQLDRIKYTAGHLIDNAEQHNVGGYALLIIREINKQDGQQGIEITCIEDGRKIGKISLKEQFGRYKRIKTGGVGLYEIREYNDKVVVLDKRPGQPCKMWSSDRPDEEQAVDIPWLSPYGRMTFTRKWATSSPVQPQPPASEPGGIDLRGMQVIRK